MSRRKHRMVYVPAKELRTGERVRYPSGAVYERQGDGSLRRIHEATAKVPPAGGAK